LFVARAFVAFLGGTMVQKKSPRGAFK